jgi:hypothetical protein
LIISGVDILKNYRSSQKALDMIKELAPGLYKHAIFKNKAVQKILDAQTCNGVKWPQSPHLFINLILKKSFKPTFFIERKACIRAF